MARHCLLRLRERRAERSRETPSSARGRMEFLFQTPQARRSAIGWRSTTPSPDFARQEPSRPFDPAGQPCTPPLRFEKTEFVQFAGFPDVMRITQVALDLSKHSTGVLDAVHAFHIAMTELGHDVEQISFDRQLRPAEDRPGNTVAVAALGVPGLRRFAYAPASAR